MLMQLLLLVLFLHNYVVFPQPSVPFLFEGTVFPQGNYHIFVRTLPSVEVSTILASYDDKIRNTENEMKQKNAAWMKHQIIPGLREERFKVQNAFGVLGDAIINDDTKFEFKLDWKKAHDAYFKQKFDPIYVQIWTVDGPFETSLIERILINPSSETTYEFIYGTPREQIGVPKSLLGRISIPSAVGEIVEKYVVKKHPIIPSAHVQDQMVEIDADGNFAIEFTDDDLRPPRAEEFILSFFKAENPMMIKPKVFTLDNPTTALSFGSELDVEIDFLESKLVPSVNENVNYKFKIANNWQLNGIIKNLPEIDGCKVTKIEVKIFASNPLGISHSLSSSSSSSALFQKAVKCVEAKPSHSIKGSFVFSFRDLNTADLKSIESKKSALYGLRSKSVKKTDTIYLTVAPTEFENCRHLYQHKMTYPTLAQMVGDNGEEIPSRYRYKFGGDESETDKEDDDTNQIRSSIAGADKAQMTNLYQAYLDRNNSNNNNKHLLSEEEIRARIDAFKVQLQMVQMKAFDSK